jgi:phosphoribosylformylglycinamidine synthase PurS subunit
MTKIAVRVNILRASAGSAIQSKAVKARVYVSFKTSVLDPQGQTIRAALNGLGHSEIEDVRQGKYFEITMRSGADRERAKRDLDEIARDVLSNPVIEDYRIELVE